MASNYLEELVAQWYEFNGYLLRRNIHVGKRQRGGYDCELDIVGFNPDIKHLVHIEPSMDADSWTVREQRYRKKFDAGKKHIPILFKGIKLPEEIEQIALFVFASKENHQSLGGGRIMLVSDLIEEIFQKLKNMAIASSAIPEHLHILRSFQFVNESKISLVKMWEEPSQKNI